MSEHFATTKRSALICASEVRAQTGLSTAALNAAIQQRSFPRPIIDAGQPKFYQAEVTAWMALPKACRRVARG